jgi:hypothetical protein
LDTSWGKSSFIASFGCDVPGGDSMRPWVPLFQRLLCGSVMIFLSVFVYLSLFCDTLFTVRATSWALCL